MYEKYAELRDKAGLNDFQVAQKTDISPSTIYDWKYGKYRPKVDKLQKIAKAIGCKLEELL